MFYTISKLTCVVDEGAYDSTSTVSLISLKKNYKNIRNVEAIGAQFFLN